jgi:hypothetical protein
VHTLTGSPHSWIALLLLVVHIVLLVLLLLMLRTAVLVVGHRLDKKKKNPMNSITFVLFGKYCLIVDQLGSKDSSRDFQLNCVISYFFTYIYYFIGPTELIG